MDKLSKDKTMDRAIKRISIFALFLSLTSIALSNVIVIQDDDDPRELLNTGLAYYIGQNGYKQDYTKAYEYLKRAADLNNADAQAVIGIMFENGYGITRDYSKAVEWYKKAAAEDQSNAQNSLGLLYLNGKGVEKDKEQALYWFRKAFANGNKSAEQYVVMLESGERKIALIIGNANYPKGKLSTPTNDAQSVSSMLQSLGFEVILKTNLELQGMNQIIDEFCQKATDYDAALFYYSGYAVQLEGVNYLIPAKSYLEPSTIMYDCINMSRFMAKLEASNVDKKIIILDACRDNSELVRGKGSIKQGLARISQYGYFNVLSAQADKTVTDKKGEKNSVFTKEFVDGMNQPNVPLYQMFKDIQANVSNKTNKEQIPSINDDLVGTFYFNYKHNATGIESSSTSGKTASLTNNLTQVRHEYVDLGLSVKWATYNVGASKPEEYGDYYAWGETATKEYYEWDSYKWCEGSETTLTKYCNSRSYGKVDGKNELDAGDDVAHVKWGGYWRMPTLSEQIELRNNCKWTWTTRNGVSGYLVTSNKIGYTNRSIFLPAGGYVAQSELHNVGISGCYWSSTLRVDGYPYYAYCFFLTSNVAGWDNYGYRNCGRSVRPVCP